MNKDKQKIERLAYSLDEAAEMVGGCSRGHLINEKNRGKIRFVKSGRRVMITAAELKRYLKECETAPAA